MHAPSLKPTSQIYTPSSRELLEKASKVVCFFCVCVCSGDGAVLDRLKGDFSSVTVLAPSMTLRLHIDLG